MDNKEAKAAATDQKIPNYELLKAKAQRSHKP